MPLLKLLILAATALILHTAAAQDGAITVRFIGNCGLHFTDGERSLYTDFPYKSGAHKYMTYPAAELDSIGPNSIFLFTHRHSDHYSRKLLRRALKRYGGQAFDNWNTKKLARLDDPASGFHVQAIRTTHLFTLKHYSYVITWHGKRIYISGDTGSYTELAKLDSIDHAFMNPWLLMNAQNDGVKLPVKDYAIYHLYPTQELPAEVPDWLVFLKEQGWERVLK